MGTEAELRAHGAALYGALSAVAPRPEGRGLEDPLGRLARIARRAMGEGPPFTSVRALRAALLVALGEDEVPPAVRAHVDALGVDEAPPVVDDRTIPDDLFALTGLAAVSAGGSPTVRALDEPAAPEAAVGALLVDDRADTLQLERYVPATPGAGASAAQASAASAIGGAAPAIGAPATGRAAPATGALATGAPVNAGPAPGAPSSAPAGSASHAAPARRPPASRARAAALAVIVLAAVVIVACLVELAQR